MIRRLGVNVDPVATLRQAHGAVGRLGRAEHRRLVDLPVAGVEHAAERGLDQQRVALGPEHALASAANYAAKIGWRRGEPWLEEVQVPADLPWDQSGLDLEHPRSQWSRWGVTRAGGGALVGRLREEHRRRPERLRELLDPVGVLVQEVPEIAGRGVRRRDAPGR